MEVSILPEHLGEALGELRRVTPKRGALPILTNVLAEDDAGRLKLTASDLTQTLTCWVGAVWEETGSCVLPVEQLVKMLPRMGTDALTLSADGVKVEVVTGERRLSLVSDDPNDFPPSPDVEGEWGTVERLAEGLKRVAFCMARMARDDRRPVLAGVYFEADGDNLTLTAVDGDRLAHASLSYSGPSFSAIVPAPVVGTLMRLAKGDVTIRADDRNIMFDLGGMWQLVTRAVEGTFPNYGNIVPGERQRSVTVDRDVFRDEVATAMVIVRDTAVVVRLEIEGNDTLSIRAKAEGVGEYRARIPARMGVVGDDGKVAVDGRYLDAFCGGLNKGPMTLDWEGTGDIVRVRQDGFDGFYLVMPMTVEWGG